MEPLAVLDTSVRVSPRARALAALLAMLVGVASGTATLRLLWCAPMHEARLTCCCPTSGPDTCEIGHACCEAQERAAIPDTTARDAHDTIAAPSYAPFPALVVLDAREDRALARRAAVVARAGPGLRVHARASVYLI
ncbi:MAG: hypothetical protein K8H88_02245 [Sandaracinaceae bacterium]|nr:hypothetical protein [Sandaracinaceae bacterium]